MSFVTIHFYVIMLFLLVNAVPGGIKDVSDACFKMEKLKYVLTATGKNTDAVWLKIAIQEKFSCTLSFSVQANSFMGMILKFPDRNRKICIVEGDSVVTVSEWSFGKTCTNHNYNGVYSRINEGSLTVNVISYGALKELTITASTLKPVNNGQCSNGEVQCRINNDMYCISRDISCDEIVPCGFKNDNASLESALSGSVIIFTIAMTVTTVVVIAAFLWNLFPKRGRTFIYKLDEQLTPYDIQFSNLNIEVVVLIVFPDGTNKKND